MQEVRIKLGTSRDMVFTKSETAENIGLVVHTEGVDFHYAVSLSEMKKLHDFIVSEVFGPVDPIMKRNYENVNAAMNDLADEMLKNG